MKRSRKAVSTVSRRSTLNMASTSRGTERPEKCSKSERRVIKTKRPVSVKGSSKRARIAMKAIKRARSGAAVASRETRRKRREMRAKRLRMATTEKSKRPRKRTEALMLSWRKPRMLSTVGALASLAPRSRTRMTMSIELFS